MATVTMSGQEYKELLLAQEELERLRNLTVRAHDRDYREESSYDFGKPIRPLPFDQMFVEEIIDSVTRQLLALDDTRFHGWVMSGRKYYSIDNRSFYEYEYGQSVDMTKRNGELENRWEYWSNVATVSDDYIVEE